MGPAAPLAVTEESGHNGANMARMTPEQRKQRKIEREKQRAAREALYKARAVINERQKLVHAWTEPDANEYRPHGYWRWFRDLDAATLRLTNVWVRTGEGPSPFHGKGTDRFVLCMGEDYGMQGSQFELVVVEQPEAARWGWRLLGFEGFPHDAGYASTLAEARNAGESAGERVIQELDDDEPDGVD